MSTPRSRRVHLTRRYARQVACVCVSLLILSGCKEPVDQETASDAPVSQAEEAKQTPDQPKKGRKRIFDAWLRWQSVTPIIEDQALERTDGEVSIRFRIKNSGTETISFSSFTPHFAAGTYYSHPDGTPYTVEGDDRNISIWFMPSAYYREPSSVIQIAVGQERSLTATVEVPDDMPNPVKVSVCVYGPFVEASLTLGTPRKLTWVERTKP